MKLKEILPYISRETYLEVFERDGFVGSFQVNDLIVLGNNPLFEYPQDRICDMNVFMIYPDSSVLRVLVC